MTSKQHSHEHQTDNPHNHDYHDHEHHGHDHNHSHGSGGHVHVAQNKLKVAIFLGLVVLAAEVVGGFWANSLALLSDAGHMLTDVAALIVAWMAIRLSSNPPSPSMTYGYHRVTILAALFNALTLIGIALFIGGEAYKRMLDPQSVEGAILFITAAIGIVVNLYIGLGMRDQADNVNIKSAMLHVFGDAAASAGVIAAGIIMYFTKWYILDPIVSVIIAVIVAFGAWRVIKETYIVLMEGTPVGINFKEVENSIRTVTGVKEVHDLHIWSLTSNRNAMTGHVVVDGEISVSKTQEIIREIENIVSKKYRIGHSTLQFEDDKHPHEQEMFSLDSNWKH
ncbi:cation diffusion facilitator family transporter [Paenibacillus chondroitinus]|uniref:Cation diffusion facilitator family transporter n=1 Tax=Paenibacillus chondroitinus TaxID=59842 RepID=A0ABU6DGI8_9BACL|nr:MULTISPECIES: cation diffusion facilitator family transporter [Paenibacillus]MCY9659480.1 cation diffusion facilitator family transporter [Paenibacillus anseongense]MEB4796875.1 cation diffusion facilitator family transporter [Paenibacillus chondroitinus]